MKAIKLICLFTSIAFNLPSFCQDHFGPYNLNDTVIQVGVNYQFELELLTISDGGYILSLDTIDTTKLQIINKETIKKSHEPRTGNGRFEVWTFLTKQTGDYKLFFYYKPPQADEAIKTLIIRIIVN